MTDVGGSVMREVPVSAAIAMEPPGRYVARPEIDR